MDIRHSDLRVFPLFVAALLLQCSMGAAQDSRDTPLRQDLIDAWTRRNDQIITLRCEWKVMSYQSDEIQRALTTIGSQPGQAANADGQAELLGKVLLERADRFWYLDETRASGSAKQRETYCSVWGTATRLLEGSNAGFPNATVGVAENREEYAALLRLRPVLLIARPFTNYLKFDLQSPDAILDSEPRALSGISCHRIRFPWRGTLLEMFVDPARDFLPLQLDQYMDGKLKTTG